jgi:DNA invertase Pin-like site-specific DNA recombinase
MKHFLQLPNDATAIERKIVNFAYANIYALTPDPLDKFIIAFMFDMGNSVETTAVATGLHRKTVWERSNKIRKVLEGIRLDKTIFDE